MKKGDYFTLVGSYEGVVWTGREWQRFLCQGCAIQLGLAKTRIQGPMTSKAAEACGLIPRVRGDNPAFAPYSSNRRINKTRAIQITANLKDGAGKNGLLLD